MRNFHILILACTLGWGGVVDVGRAAVPLPTVPMGASPLDPSVSLMRSLIQSYRVDVSALERRHVATSIQSRAARMREHIAEVRSGLDRVGFESLDRGSQIDYLLLRARLRFDREELDREEHQQMEMNPWLPFRGALSALVGAPRGEGDLDASTAAREASRIADAVSGARTALEEALKKRSGDGSVSTSSIPSRVVANRLARTLDRIRDSLREWNTFYSGYDPEFTWWMRQPMERCEKQLTDYAMIVRREVVGEKQGDDAPLIGDPIGRQALMQALEVEMIPFTPEELIRIGEEEFRWCEREWKRAAGELGLGEDWRKALDQVANLHVRPGSQPRLIRELADEAVGFLEERGLVTIPSLCKEIWRMEMMPPDRQKVNPYFTGGEVISVSFPTDTMAHEDKIMSLRGNNVHFCRATVHHELIPGHHLQLFMAARHQTHRELFRTPFLVEGWALYWELLLWDLGFPKTAQDRVGMLFWRTHRCARIVFSLKFHMGQMTAPEAVDYLVERVGHERRNATAEVRRSIIGGYGPLYQAAYMLGGLQFRALRRELVDTGRMTDRAFHDAILRENSIPVEMIRASLSGQALSRDFQSRWKFYELK